MSNCIGCMGDRFNHFGECKNRAEVCELEITGNLSTLRCNRFPDRRNGNGNGNNGNNFNINNNNNNNNNTSNGINFLPETVRTRYAQSVASIAAGNGANPRFYSRMSRTVNGR